MVDKSQPVGPGSGAAGCYLLRLTLPESITLVVGKAGSRQFLAGAYLYVGSAFGPGGVRARLAHHLRLSQRPHWHIDYLRHHAQVDEIWFAETGQRLEHTWADAVSEMPETVPVLPGLGASDCRCPTHLFYFSSPPRLATFNEVINRRAEKKLKSDIGYMMQRWRVRALSNAGV